MQFEQINTHNKIKRDLELADNFKQISPDNLNSSPFEELEEELFGSGFDLADNQTVFDTLHDNSLLCRSENFSKIMRLVTDNTPIDIQNPEGLANMCSVSSTAGYRIAMSEGFSGSDVNHTVKVVVTFSDDNISSHTSIPNNNNLWSVKPQTAAVSQIGHGQITREDVRLISFRFPVHLYPENMLSETEKEMLEEDKVKFIVRHYSPKKKPAH